MRAFPLLDIPTVNGSTNVIKTVADFSVRVSAVFLPFFPELCDFLTIFEWKRVMPSSPAW